ncbi:MAG: hypothetical protein LLG05_08750 [Porphyromonadaceae bacterium]|nr:hypothetical protein [Porphyromonadaceae bacterium]
MEINKFSIKNNLHDPKNESSILYYNAKFTGTILDGCTIEKQFIIDGYFLIISSYGWACEETNYVTLLNNRFNIISKKRIGFAYCSMSVSAALPKRDNELFITFTNGASVIVKMCRIPFMLGKPFLRLKKWKYATNAQN